jgi:hypothetical protein
MVVGEADLLIDVSLLNDLEVLTIIIVDLLYDVNFFLDLKQFPPKLSQLLIVIDGLLEIVVYHHDTFRLIVPAKV